MITMMARSPADLLRQDVDAMIKQAADRRSTELTTDAMNAAVAAMIGSRRHNLGVTHLQDLDRHLPAPPRHGDAARTRAAADLHRRRAVGWV